METGDQGKRRNKMHPSENEGCENRANLFQMATDSNEDSKKPQESQNVLTKVKMSDESKNSSKLVLVSKDTKFRRG